MSMSPDLLGGGVELDGAAVDHLQRLLSSWGMLADFCFSDLVLYVLDSHGRYVMANHIRPTTAQTIYHGDIVGEVRDPTQRPLIDNAYRSGAVRRGEIDSAWLGERVRVAAIPVRLGQRTIAVLAREYFSSFRHHPGELEQTYEDVFERFATMIASGLFPFPEENVRLTTMPRVGDGVVLLGPGGLVEYSSPNANSTLSRSGVESVKRGVSLGDLGFDVPALRAGLATGRPGVGEIERPGDVTVAVRILPFLAFSPGEGRDAGERPVITGAVALLRDISDLRLRDRMLLSKDAAISEIHHRVKNNLQTISSLLRLESRRLDEPTARAVIEESVRRIHSISLVHEILSRDSGDDVEFREVLKPLVRMVSEGLVSPEAPIHFEIDGFGGVVSSEVATSLALVVTELLQNAVEHAFPADSPAGRPQPRVRLTLSHDAQYIRIRVADNGVGIDDSIDLGGSGSLGQSIIHALVRDELRGTITFGRGDGSHDVPGTGVEIEVPSRKQWV